MKLYNCFFFNFKFYKFNHFNILKNILKILILFYLKSVNKFLWI
ncbi:hypothetical protein QUR95_00150 [Candidatus Nasuia deltocephalinicola]|nr:hypothetical protein QUR95_00150 [Candidatus Nasuia deltocephalinicola]